MDPDTFQQTNAFEINDDYVKHSIFFKNGAEWKADRTAISQHFTGSKMRSLLHYFKGVTDNFLNNVAELNRETGNRPINVKSLFKCYGIDCISKFIFAIDCNSFKDEWVLFARLF